MTKLFERRMHLNMCGVKYGMEQGNGKLCQQKYSECLHTLYGLQAQNTHTVVQYLAG